MIVVNFYILLVAMVVRFSLQRFLTKHAATRSVSLIIPGAVESRLLREDSGTLLTQPKAQLTWNLKVWVFVVEVSFEKNHI